MSYWRVRGDYEYDLETVKIPAWGAYNYRSKVIRVAKRLANGELQEVSVASLGLHLQHGETSEEAQSKVETEANAEIDRMIAGGS